MSEHVVVTTNKRGQRTIHKIRRETDGELPVDTMCGLRGVAGSRFDDFNDNRIRAIPECQRCFPW